MRLVGEKEIQKPFVLETHEKSKPITFLLKIRQSSLELVNIDALKNIGTINPSYPLIPKRNI
jgi:hypothetical protein